MTEPPHVDGCVLVVRGTETIHQAAHGIADPVAGTECAANTRFQIASISKQFTAAAILLLAEAKQLTLTDQVRQWIPGCPPSWDPITIHQLLTHTSGLGHWEDYPRIDLTEPMDDDVLRDEFQRLDPLQTAGSFYYSSPAYVLLAHIVERAGGMRYRDFLTESLFNPVGMHDTFVGSPNGQPNVATGFRDAAPTKSFELDHVGMGAGDAWSTTGDLVRWDQALAAGLILSERSRELSFAHHVNMAAAKPEDYYGYGWMMAPMFGHATRHHSGDNAGFNAYNVWLPEQSGYVVVLCNHDDKINTKDKLHRVLRPLIELAAAPN